MRGKYRDNRHYKKGYSQGFQDVLKDLDQAKTKPDFYYGYGKIHGNTSYKRWHSFVAGYAAANRRYGNVAYSISDFQRQYCQSDDWKTVSGDKFGQMLLKGSIEYRLYREEGPAISNREIQLRIEMLKADWRLKQRQRRFSDEYKKAVLPYLQAQLEEQQG